MISASCAILEIVWGTNISLVPQIQNIQGRYVHQHFLFIYSWYRLMGSMEIHHHCRSEYLLDFSEEPLSCAELKVGAIITHRGVQLLMILFHLFKFWFLFLFTQAHIWPLDIVVAYVCVSVHKSVFVSVTSLSVRLLVTRSSYSKQMRARTANH